MEIEQPLSAAKGDVESANVGLGRLTIYTTSMASSLVTLLALRNGGANALSFSPGTLTVFVGPNHSGKSLALREIMSFFRKPHTGRVIVESLTVDAPADERAFLSLLRTRATEAGGRFTWPPFKGAHHGDLAHSNLPGLLAHREARGRLLGLVLGLQVDGATRLSLLEEIRGEDLQSPRSHLGALFTNDEARSLWRESVASGVDLFPVIDPTNLGRLRVRFSERSPSSNAEEQGLDATSRAFHGAAIPAEDASDGVRAFAGMLSLLQSSPFRLITIDEPEAFLHPPLAQRFGHELARLAVTRCASVFVATHSADFLMGCIEAGVRVDVVRLSYFAGIGGARRLDHETLTRMMCDPLMRSSSVLRGVFSRGVVVCESDSDRAFYQEVNHRLLERKEGSRATLFIQAQNKQTVHRIVGPLRMLGVPAAAIVDLDMLKNDGTEWTALFDACQVPEVLRSSLSQFRGDIRKKLNAVTPNPWKQGGLETLEAPDREAAETVFAQLADYGLFLVPNGELESWLRDLGVSGHGPSWVVPMLDRMGSDPNAGTYVHPSEGDVWAFVRAIGRWIGDPARKGVA